MVSPDAPFLHQPRWMIFEKTFASILNRALLPLEGELADARYERLTEEVCGKVLFCR